MEKLAYTIPEVGKAANLGRTMVYQQISLGNLVARKVGNKTLILAADLKLFLEKLPLLQTRTNGPGDGRDS